MTLLEQHVEVRNAAERVYQHADKLKAFELAALYGRVIMLLDEACRLVLDREGGATP